jgi:NAD+ diphosphatase
LSNRLNFSVQRKAGIDYGELEDARWFTRDWLLSHTDDDSFRLPRLDSIARRLIEDWLHG